MSSKWRYILGTATIALIVGGTIYAIKKSKDAEKEEGEAISLDEAREIVKSKQTKESENTEDSVEEVIEEEPKTHKIKGVKASSIIYDEMLGEEFDELDEDDPLRDDYPEITEEIEGPTFTVEPLTDFMYIDPNCDIDPKEDKRLRYDPNSPEAKHQFIRMELADWQPNHPVYRVMLQLFEFPFIPTNDGDEILRTQVIDYKVQFYGWNSKWNKEVSYADIMFHYARGAEFNCGESVQFWVEHFLDHIEFDWTNTSQQFDTQIMRLNNHSYFNEERQTFGLFGLTRNSMDQAIRIANMNIDRSVTYEIEFNEFLKSCI